MKNIYKFLRWISLLIVLGIIFIFVNHAYVSNTTANKLYYDINKIPKHKTGLLLGTAKKLSNGRLNYYYKHRIDAAVELYNAGKISNIIVSGDNGTIYYDETTTMQKDLLARGIPKSKIFLDYAGFRTLDSVVRSQAIFGQNSIIIISQDFHNERAVYIAQSKGIKAIAYNAKNVNKQVGRKTRTREYFARVKMQLDLLFGKAPKFLGDRIEIP